MKFESPLTLAEMAELINADEYVGLADFPVLGMNEIHRVEKGDMVFVDHPKYYDKALQSAATIVLINKKVECPEGKALIISKDPFQDFIALSQRFRPVEKKDGTESIQVGENTIIQPGARIGKGVIIGKDCLIHENAVIGDGSVIGDRVEIHSGASIGADAFYYQKREGRFVKFHSCGRVVIEDDVEIGANSCIDRGVTADTIIGEGTKIDNLVQVGHDTVVGKHCLFAAQVGVAGCVTIEDHVTLWGQVGVRSDVVLGEGCEVYAQSGVSKDLEPGKKYFGSPCIEAADKMKEMAAIRRLPQIIRNMS